VRPLKMYDVAIVGSSFSGAMAALSVAKSEKVLIIEKRKQPGSPVNTTGAVPIEWLKKMNVFPSEDCIAGRLRGVELVAPNGDRAVLKKEQPDGMVLYPDLYVKWLSQRAVDKGCTLLTDTSFLGLKPNNSNGKSANAEGGYTISTSKGEFKADYIIGADGTASAVGQAAGLGERPAPEDLHLGMEYTFENNNVQDPEIFSLFLGHEVAPLGYAWSFPEGTKYLRVGLGIPQSLGLRPKVLIDKFLAKYPEFKTSFTKSNGGMIPTAPPLKTAVKGNILLVGDAAHFCSPLHGGGIWFGMHSGILAAEAISKRNPELYEQTWKEQLGGVLSRHYKLKKVIYSMSDNNFDDLVDMLKVYLVAQSANYSFAHMAQKILFSDPGFMMDMAMKWAKYGLAIDAIKRVVVPSFRIA